MYKRPFTRLPAPRPVDRPDLPADLAAFYARYEGCGRDADWTTYGIGLYQLGEVTRVGWAGLGLVGDVPEGWDGFAALRIGSGMFFDRVVYVLSAPVCRPGSVMAVGSNPIGPAGVGPNAVEGALVLAPTFADRLAHLERWGWAEPAITGMDDPGPEKMDELRRYYLALNPELYQG